MSALGPGFTNPVLDAQATFRAILTAMSRPGRILSAGCGLHPPPPLTPAAAAVLLTLADAETPLWTDTPLPLPWLRFHCGMPILTNPAAAAFVLVTASLPPLLSLPAGTEEEPERGATVILQVTALIGGEGWRLRGPGIAREERLRVIGLPPDFSAQWANNTARFPCGVDVILCAGEQLVALPRTVHIEEG